MKTIFTSLLLLVSSLVMANFSILPDVQISKIAGSKKVVVSIETIKAEGELLIKDLNGAVLLSEDLEGPAYSKAFNLELLQPGEYFIDIRLGQKEVEQPIIIDTKQITIDDQKRREFLLPLVKLDQKMVNVMMLNRRITDVTIKIRDTYGDVLYTDKLGAVVKVEKRYDVAALGRGHYQVVVETPEKTYYQDIYND